MSKIERRTAVRATNRPDRIVALRYCKTGSGMWLTSQTMNIGVGGAYLLSTDPFAIGTPITLELRIDDRAPLLLTAVVRWCDRFGPTPGMGVQFANVDIDVMLQLNAYLTQARAAT